MTCKTCGGDRCSSCGAAFTEPPLHIFWGEDICMACSREAERRLDEYMREQGLEDDA